MSNGDFTTEAVVAEMPKNARETLRASLTVAFGVKCVDLRVFVPDDKGGMLPTRKGLTIARDKITDLHELVGKLAEACEGEPEESRG